MQTSYVRGKRQHKKRGRERERERENLFSLSAFFSTDRTKKEKEEGLFPFHHVHKIE
jgi:hypothetical protein